MNLEEQLRRALAPQDPPSGFAARVAARIREPHGASGSPAARRGLIGMAMAATVIIGTASTLYYAHERQIAEAERVRSEAVTGLRIASAKLNDVHERLLRHSVQYERSR